MKDRSSKGAAAPDNPLRVAIADDMELMRIGLRHALESVPDLSVVGAAANGREAIELCSRLRPELVLLDERMPVMDGLEATRVIKQRFPGILVIVLSPQGDPRGRLGALQAGADGWVLKNVSRSELIATVRQVHHGETQYSTQAEAELLRRIAGLAADQPRLRVDQLTPRELDVLRLLVQGKTNVEIADELALSRGTVKAYVERIIAKLHVTSRTHAAVRAVELGLLQVPAE